MPELGSTGKILIIAGIVLIAAGLFVTIGAKHIPLGRLPGDIFVKRENISFYFPIVTCIIISILLTLIFHFFRK